jgi:WD40 repeat protein
LWEAATGQFIGQPLVHGNHITALAFSGDGRMVAIADLNGVAKLWDATTGKLLQTFDPPREARYRKISGVAISPDGKTVATATAGDKDKAVRLWDVATGTVRATFPHPNVVQGVAFNPDGRTLLTGCADRTARLWDLETGQVIGPPLKHPRELVAVTFSVDGRLAATSGGDNTARLWDVATGQPIGAPLPHPEWATVLAFTQDGQGLWTGSYEVARRWPVPLPVKGDKERVTLGVQVLTGMELNDYGLVDWLDAATWQQRRQRLFDLDNQLK